MEDNLKSLQDWANQMQSQLEEYKKHMDNTIKDLPKEEQDKFNEAFNDIDLEDIKKVANDASLSILNHIKSKM